MPALYLLANVMNTFPLAYLFSLVVAVKDCNDPIVLGNERQQSTSMGRSKRLPRRIVKYFQNHDFFYLPRRLSYNASRTL